MPRANQRHRREQRAADAARRQAAYDALTQSEKIAKAQAAPGRSLRQLARLGAAA